MTGSIDEYGGENHTGYPDRPIARSMARGFLNRCPQCGEGKLFARFIKTVERCDVCHEDIHHHRADDLPAYLVIFLVGHFIVAAFMGVETMFEWSMAAHLTVWTILTVALSIALLRPVKGAVVGLQWANRMHGFGGTDEDAIAYADTHPENTQSAADRA